MKKKLFMSDNKLIYILERLNRSFDSVIKIIDRLDLYSLEIKKSITYKNIKFFLNELSEN